MHSNGGGALFLHQSLTKCFEVFFFSFLLVFDLRGERRRGGEGVGNAHLGFLGEREGLRFRDLVILVIFFNGEGNRDLKI